MIVETIYSIMCNIIDVDVLYRKRFMCIYMSFTIGTRRRHWRSWQHWPAWNNHKYAILLHSKNVIRLFEGPSYISWYLQTLDTSTNRIRIRPTKAFKCMD